MERPVLEEVLVGLGLLGVELDEAQPEGGRVAGLRLLVVDAVFGEVLLAESAQLPVDEVLAADGFPVGDCGALQVGAEAGLAGVGQQAAGALAGARLGLLGVGGAGAAGDPASALVDLEDVAHAEF